MTAKTKNKFTQKERHAVLLGFFEIIAPWPPLYKLDPPAYLKDEQHYYHGGRAAGVITWLILAKVIHLVFF